MIPNTKTITGFYTGRLWSVEPFEGKLRYWIGDAWFVTGFQWKLFGKTPVEAINKIERGCKENEESN